MAGAAWLGQAQAWPAHSATHLRVVTCLHHKFAGAGTHQLMGLSWLQRLRHRLEHHHSLCCTVLTGQQGECCRAGREARCREAEVNQT